MNDSQKQVVQWFPGHMAKTRRQIKESLPMVDAVTELLDARVPMSSRNPEFDELTAGKPRIVLLNKCDVADEKATREWLDWFAKNGAAARFLLFEFQPECFHVGQLWFLIDSLMVITLYFLFSKLAFLPKKLSPKTKGVILTVVIFVLGVGGLVVFNKTDNAFYFPVLNIKAFMRPALPIPDLPLKSDTAVCALLFFYIGVLLNKSGFKNKIYGLKSRSKIGGIVLFGLITFAVSRLNEPVNICDCQFGNPVFYLVGSLSGVLMTILTACVLSRGFVKRLLAYTGQNSLLIFPSILFSF